MTGNKAYTMRFVILAEAFRNLLARNLEEAVEISRSSSFGTGCTGSIEQVISKCASDTDVGTIEQPLSFSLDRVH